MRPGLLDDGASDGQKAGFRAPEARVPDEKVLLPGMTKTKKAYLSRFHPQLTWAQQGMLEFIWQNEGCTKKEIHAASDDAEFSTENRLRELKKLGLVRGEQAIKGSGRGSFGQSRYYVTEMALSGVPAGTEMAE